MESEINHNLQRVVLVGRRPELKRLDGSSQTLTEEGSRLLDDLVTLATLLDGTESTAYKDALRHQRSKFSNPENTPSAKTLRMMEEHDGSFFEFAITSPAVSPVGSKTSIDTLLGSINMG